MFSRSFLHLIKKAARQITEILPLRDNAVCKALDVLNLFPRLGWIILIFAGSVPRTWGHDRLVRSYPRTNARVMRVQPAFFVPPRQSGEAMPLRTSRALLQAPNPRAGQAGRLGRVAPNRNPGFFKLYRDLPPGQQRRALENDPRFERLPPWRQAAIRRRLRNWNLMTPEQQTRFKEREEVFESLSPTQRQEARQLFPQWRDLPQDRRRRLMQAFRYMRTVPAGKREQFLNGPAVLRNFSSRERELLRGLGRLLPDSPRAGGF